MDCYLSWDLNEMTNISVEKLQKNISQQSSYLELYKKELVKEALNVNIACALKYVNQHNLSFGNDNFSKKATDCLIVFLHAMAFQKEAYFLPLDEETSMLAKTCRNLHRLMIENLKATMRYIDYCVLLERATGKTSLDGMFSLRCELYSKVFPNENLVNVCNDENVNNSFFSLIDAENSTTCGFAGYDVQETSTLDESICEFLSLLYSSVEVLEDSPYGVIGSSVKYLETPFIKYSGRYYGFVTRFSLVNIREMLAVLSPVENEEPCESKVSCENEFSCNKESDPYEEKSLFDCFEDLEVVPVAEPELERSSDPILEQEIKPNVEPSLEMEQEVEPALIQEPKQEMAPVPELKLQNESTSIGVLDIVLKAFGSPNPFTSYVDSCDDVQRVELSTMIDKAVCACKDDGRDKVLVIPSTAISVCVFRLSKDPMLEIQRKEHIGALMYAKKRDVWHSVELYLNENGVLESALYNKITKFVFSSWQWKVVEKMGLAIAQRGDE